MKPIRVEERRVRSFDGTDIAYHVVGRGLPVLLANGLGGSWKAWSHQIAYLEDRYRFVSWDYRGLYRSGPPPSIEALRIEDQVRDALTVLDTERIDRVAVLGWSMGVQLALELFHRAPERVAAMVLLNGVAGHPWRSVFGLTAMQSMIPPVLRTARSLPRAVESIVRRAAHSPETVTWTKRVGLASSTLDDTIFAELAASFADLDMRTYIRTLELLGEHDASAVLPEIDVPTLVVAGDRDVMTPRAAAEQMVRRIKGAELLVVPGGTHYVAVEYPELVSLRVDKFFRERGYAEGAPATDSV